MKILTNTLILVALLMLVAICASAQVPGPVSIHASCTQTLTPSVGAYSGPLAITAWQFGFIAVNAITGAQSAIQFKNGVWKPMDAGCSGQSNLSFTGDCWASVVTLTASNGTPNWLVTPGGPTTCQWSNGGGYVNGLMVWKYSGSSYAVQGFAPMPSGLLVARLSTAILAGDAAWVEVAGNKWTSCDLNALTCSSTTVGTPPAGEGRQSGVNGYAYNVGIDYTHPNVGGGPVWFWLARADQPTPTRPPAPTNTMTPTGGRTWTPTRTPSGPTPTPNPCPPFCVPTSTPGGPTPTKTRTGGVTTTPSITPTPAAQRFAISIAWTKPDGSTGSGVASCSVSSSDSLSSDFWFFSPDNREISLKVLNGCAQNGFYWFFAAGLTNVAVDIDVHDSVTGTDRHYTNAQGVPFPPIQDNQMERCQ